MITENQLKTGETYYRANKDNKFGIEWLTLLGKVEGRREFLFQFGRRKVRVHVGNFHTLFLTQDEAQKDFVKRLQEYCTYYEKCFKRWG